MTLVALIVSLAALQPPPPPGVGPRGVMATIVEMSASREGVLVTLSKGDTQGIEGDWTGQVIDRAGKPLTGRLDDLRIIRVGVDETVALARRLSMGQLEVARRVRMVPPAGARLTEVTAIAPASGPPGTVVELSGKDFWAGTRVTFGGRDCVWQARVGEPMRVEIPKGARGKAPFVLLVDGQEVVTRQQFEVAP